jgi:hypothetical protein
VQDAIARQWPDGLVSMTSDPEDSWFANVEPRLTRALGRVKGAALCFEREPSSDPDLDADGDDTSRSYHLYFLSPEGEGFRFLTEAETLAEDESALSTVQGAGRVGWCAAVSLLEPFAVILFGEWIRYEDGSESEPGLDVTACDAEGMPVDFERNFREAAGEAAFEKLQALRAKIASVLEKHGLTVLTEREWKTPLPELRADPDVFVTPPLRVLDAFFFEGL